MRSYLENVLHFTFSYDHSTLMGFSTRLHTAQFIYHSTDHSNRENAIGNFHVYLILEDAMRLAIKSLWRLFNCVPKAYQRGQWSYYTDVSAILLACSAALVHTNHKTLLIQHFSNWFSLASRRFPIPSSNLYDAKYVVGVFADFMQIPVSFHVSYGWKLCNIKSEAYCHRSHKFTNIMEIAVKYYGNGPLNCEG